MLPLLVTQIPLSMAGAAAYLVLFVRVYPDAPYDSFQSVRELPPALLFWLAVVQGIYWLFTLVGLAGTMVAVAGVQAGKTPGLAASLDPAFSRMGGLLGLGVLFYVMLSVTAIGAVVVIYPIVRLGLAFHAYVLGGVRPWKAVRESWSLLRGRFLRFTGLLLVTVLLMAGVLLAAVAALALVAAPFVPQDPGRSTELALTVVVLILGGIVAVPLGAYFTTATTLFYLKARGSGDDRRSA